MTPEQLRKVATFVDALNELSSSDTYRGVGLHLYGCAEIFIEDENGDSLVKLNYDPEDGYTAALA